MRKYKKINIIDNTVKGRFFTNSTVKRSIDPNKILNNIEALLNKQKEFASEIESKEVKSKILEEVLTYRKKKMKRVLICENICKRMLSNILLWTRI